MELVLTNVVRTHLTVPDAVSSGLRMLNGLLNTNAAKQTMDGAARYTPEPWLGPWLLCILACPAGDGVR